MTDTFEDPGDAPFYLIQNGWLRLTIKDSESDFYSKKLSAGNTTMGVIIEVTPGGRRKFYVEDPPEGFREAAHDGRCLNDRGIADGETRYQVHFRKRPESLADGVRRIETMLREAS